MSSSVRKDKYIYLPIEINIDNIIYYIDMYIISGSNIHLIAVSFFVYLVVNLFENLIHYNIGRFSNKDTKFEIPTPKDWLKIIVVMFIFALLQGLLTVWFQQKK